MSGIRKPNSVDSIEEFECGLAREISPAEQYDLPLSRIQRAVPEAATGLAEHEKGDRVEDLLDCARYTSGSPAMPERGSG